MSTVLYKTVTVCAFISTFTGRNSLFPIGLEQRRQSVLYSVVVLFLGTNY